MEVKIRDKLTVNSYYPTIRCVLLDTSAVWSIWLFGDTQSMVHKDRNRWKYIFPSSVSLFQPIYYTWFKNITLSLLHERTVGKALTPETWELAPEKSNLHYLIDNVHVLLFSLSGLILWCCNKSWEWNAVAAIKSQASRYHATMM